MTDKELLRAAGEILQDEKAAEEFDAATTAEEIRLIFAERGKSLTISEVERIGELIVSDELSEEELDGVFGGLTREILLIGGIVAAVVSVGACRAAYLRIRED